MKILDVLNLLETFNRVFQDSSLTQEEKASIGGELLRLIPSEDLFVASQKSLAAVKRSIKERVEALEKENDVRTGMAGEGEVQKPKQPLRKARANA